MQKIKNKKNFIAIIAVAIVGSSVFYGCKKDTESMESLPIDKKQKLMDNYPFILPEDMQPYQYAIYEDDLPRLFDYMKSVFDSSLEGDGKGYFTLSFSVANSLYYYGFITETSSHYNPIWIDPNPDDGDDMCFTLIVRTFDTLEEAREYAKGKAKEGYETVTSKTKDGKYLVTYDDGN
jgi:hypothetical protein